MDFKDWITVLLPVIMNGIVLAFFGKILDDRFSKKELSQKRLIEISEKFYELVAKNKIDFYDFQIKATNIYDNEEKINSLQIFINDFQELLNFTEQNRIALKKYLKHIKIISSETFKFGIIFKSIASIQDENSEEIKNYEDLNNAYLLFAKIVNKKFKIIDKKYFS